MITFEKTSIEGLTIVHPHFFQDARGYFLKDFERNIYSENGLPEFFVETSDSMSKKGTIRGLHFQQRFSQGKLIRVLNGSVFDVAVDLRFDSPTFGKWEGFELSAENHKILYLPEGFAHGFMALEDNTVFQYKFTNKYAPEFESGIRFDDSDINVKWPIEKVGAENIITSDRDKNFQTFAEFKAKGEKIEW